MIFLIGKRVMVNRRMNGVQIQIAENAISANAQPHPKAMQIPQQYVRILYQQAMPQLKHLYEFRQMQSAEWAPSGSARTSSN